MCADGNLVTSKSLSMMTVMTALVMMVAAIATVTMATVRPTVIATEIISSIESKTYKGGHSGHRKIQVIKIINKHTDNGRTTLNTAYRKNNKVGNYCDHYDHPPRTLAGTAFCAFGCNGHHRDPCDQLTTLYLLTALDETAPETSVLQIPSSEAIQNHSTGAENGIGLSGSKDHRGRSRGRGDTVRIRYIFGNREF